MPELPDLTLYIEALRQRVVGVPLLRVRLASPFVLRSVEPPLTAIEGAAVRSVTRLGKRIVLACGEELYLVLHLMIAGRLRWERAGAKPPARIGLAAFDFPHGTLLLTEASPKKRAALHVVRGSDDLAMHDPGGVDPLTCGSGRFLAELRQANHTLKRVLTDPHRFSGIGNTYSDEILHAARLSPVALSTKISDDEGVRLWQATRRVLSDATQRLHEQFAGRFPSAGEITAFRPEHRVHGKLGQPCGVCGTRIQRIRYAENETNYCPRCQTDGRLLADRALSRLLKSDWPRSIDAWEERRLPAAAKLRGSPGVDPQPEPGQPSLSGAVPRPAKKARRARSHD